MEYFLLSLALLLPGATGQDCSDLEYKSAQKQFNDCATDYRDKVHEVVQAQPSSHTQRLVCEYVNTAVHECGDLLHNCHDTQGKATNSQALIDGFISVGGKYTSNCQAIVQYRKSGHLPIENTPIQDIEEINTDITQNNNFEDIQTDNDLTNLQISNEACSQANRDAAEDFMDKCSQKIGNEAYSKISHSKDPVYITNVLCSTEAHIYADCAQDPKKCFSSEYIGFLVKPIKTFLHNLAVRRVDEHSLQNCHVKADNKVNDKDIIVEPFPIENTPIQDINDINTDITEKRTQNNNFEDTQKDNNPSNLQISNEACSQAITDAAEDFMDKCSQKIGDEAYSKISNSNDPVFISNELCSAEAQIYADCVQDLKTCFSSEYIGWLVEPIKVFLHNLAVTKVDENSLKNCHEFNSLDHDKAENKDNGKDAIVEPLNYNFKETVAKPEQGKVPYEVDNNNKFPETSSELEYDQKTNNYHEQDHIEDKYTKQFIKKDKKDDDITDISHKSRDQELSSQKGYAEHIANNGRDYPDKIGDRDDVAELEYEELPNKVLFYEPTNKPEYHKTDINQESGYQEKDAENIDNYEHNDYDSNGDEEENMCDETSVIGRVGTCSHHAALKVHTVMYHNTDQNILKDTACDVLNAIGTDCVQELYDCFSKIDADEISLNHVENYKVLIINMIQVSSGVKISLENCKGLVAEPTAEDHGRETPTDNQNRYNENDRKKIDREYDTKENEIGHDKSGEEHKLCSDSERRIGEDQIKTCIQSIVNNAYSEIKNTTDPSSIARIFCAVRRRIDTDCVQHLRKCFSSEYISWFVDPLKTNLQELAVQKVDAKYLEKCHEIKPSYKSEESPSYTKEDQNAPGNLRRYETEYYRQTGDYEYYPQENEPTNAEELQYHARESSQYRDDSCSETILYERMDTCSRGIATKVWNDIKDDSSSYRVSYFVCEALTEIGTRCVSVLNNCFTSKEVSEMKSVQTNQWIKYFYRITVDTQLGRVSLDNCHLMTDQQENTEERDTVDRISYTRQETELYEKPEPTQDTIHQMHKTNPREPHYVEETANKHHEDYEECSEPNQAQTLKEMTDCSYSTAINVHRNLQTNFDQDTVTNIICNALNNIATNCVNVLYRCYTPDNIKEMKTRELVRHKNYFLKLVQNDYDSQYLENCEAVREINDHYTQEKTHSTNQEYYSQRIHTQGHHDIQDDTNQKGCSQYQMQLADDHTNECSRRTATIAVQQIRDINEPNKVFNILCSALTSINSDCVKTMRECHAEEYVTWMMEPMNKYLFDLGKEKVDVQSLQGCQYSNGFSPYKLQ